MKRTFLITLLVCFCLAGNGFSAPGEETAKHDNVGTHQDTIEMPVEDVVEFGRALFEARFTSFDGAGRPASTQAAVPTKRRVDASRSFFRTSGPDANGCLSCHNQPKLGGAGDFALNAFTTDGFVDADFDSMDPQFSNERGTTHLFGIGLVELLAREMTEDLHRIRDGLREEASRTKKAATGRLITKGVSFGNLTISPDGFIDTSGIDGIDPDLVLRPFGQKGAFTSLREFSINASNHHHGMQADERFGARWTGEADHDEDGFVNELSDGDVTALVAFQATLPPPSRDAMLDEEWQQAARDGEELFNTLGCAACHKTNLPLNSTSFAEPGPYNLAGTLRESEVARLEIDLVSLPGFENLKRDSEGNILVPLFSDLKRHAISDATLGHFGNELLGQRFVARHEFLTARLWGVGSTEPYGHRGDLTTLYETIAAHGGDARPSRNAWLELPMEKRRQVIAFLQTLVIE